MKIVVDTNRIMASLIKNGLARKIIVSPDIEFYTVDHVIDEINKYKEYIKNKSGMGGLEIELLLAIFTYDMTIIPYEEIVSKIDQATKIMESIDPNDAPILACALAISNDGIWTEDKHFEKQDVVKVWKTSDLMKNI